MLSKKKLGTLTHEQYETKLGHFIARHPVTLGCAGEMIKAAGRYIVVRAETTSRNRKEKALEIERLLKVCGRPLDDPFTGRVGLGSKRLHNVFKGQGNIRELMAHIWSFANNLFCYDVVGENRLPQALEIAKKAGLNVAVINEMIEEAVQYKGPNNTIDCLAPKEDFINMPWHKIRQAQQAMRLPNPQSATGSGWSTLTRTEFEAEGGTLSEIEQQNQSTLGPQFVPWIDARKKWLPNESHPFIKAARADGTYIVTGVSGMTMQYLQFARLFNVGPAVNVRLACLGYLLSTKSHSFHEVMTVARAFDCPYDEESDCTNLPPLSTDEIVNACGKW